MIELLLKDNKIHSIDNVHEMVNERMDFVVIQFHDYTQEDVDWVKEQFNLDLSIMYHYEDIEISSHFLENNNQVSFHFSIPYYNKEGKMIEEPVFFILFDNRVFLFTSSLLDSYLMEMYGNKFLDLQKVVNQDGGIYQFPFEFISDYYADITESLAKMIKVLASKLLIENTFTADDMNLITRYNFNNLLIKESVNETIRIFNLSKKNNFGKTEAIKEVINTELDDLAVVSDYIQFNLERLRDLRDHINNKIDFEQNRIFKILTIATICIASPTLVAGIYGMNFDIMPELHWWFGYPVVIIIMILCAILPYLYFKKKKWL